MMRPLVLLVACACGGSTPAPARPVVEATEAAEVAEHVQPEGCTRDGWCRVGPDRSPAIAHVWALAPDDVWARSTDRQLLHWDAERWWDVPNTLADPEDHHRVGVTDFSGTAETGLWGRSRNRLYRYLDGAWVHDATLADHTDYVSYVIGGTPTYIGDQGMCRFEGEWSCESEHTAQIVYQLGAIHGSAPDDLYGVQRGGKVHHWDGSAWNEVASGMYTLRAVYSPAPDVVYAIGPNIGLMRNATGWGRVESLGGNDNYVIVGTGVDDIFVGGEASTIQHFDGRAWSSMETGLRGVRSISAIEGFAVAGGAGGVSLFDGETWEPQLRTQAGSNTHYVCLRATQDGMMALASNGTLRRSLDGPTERVELREPTRCYDTGPVVAMNPSTMLRVDGSVERAEAILDVAGDWAVANRSVWHRGEGGWELELLPDAGARALTEHDGTLWVVGRHVYRGDGTTWTELEGEHERLEDVIVAPDGKVFAVGETIYELGDRIEPAITPLTTDDFTDVWARSADDVYAVTYETRKLAHFDGREWTLEDTPVVGGATSVHGFGDELFVGSDNGLWRRHRGAWTRLMEAGTTVETLGGARADAMLVGDREGRVHRRNGDGWDVVRPAANEAVVTDLARIGEALYVVAGRRVFRAPQDTERLPIASLRHWFHTAWGATESDVWAGGARMNDPAVLMRWDGERARRVETPADVGRIARIRGARADDVWMTTGSGTLLHWNGQELERIECAVRSLEAIAPTGSNEAWAVGEHGTIVRVRGGRCEASVEPHPRRLSRFFSSEHGLYATGSGGPFYRYEEGRWHREAAPIAHAPVHDMWLGAERVAVSVRGIVLRRGVDGTWARMESGTGVDLHAIEADQTHLWAVGDAGTIIRLARDD